MKTLSIKQSSENSTFELLNSHHDLIRFNKPCIMGIINMSPNSFYQPYLKLDQAIDAVADMFTAGAQMIDIGGEATNPYIDLLNEKPDTTTEMERILPLIEAIKKRFPIWVSVDTSNPQVMEAAILGGADMINDQRSLKNVDALSTVVNLQSSICIMHFFHEKRIPGSSDLLTLLQTIQQELSVHIERCLAAGVDKRRLVIDPGFGQGHYGKNCEENYYLLAHLEHFTRSGYPVLVGWSRKSMIGETLGGVSPDKRLAGSVAAATLAASKGASIIRVHDVPESIDAMKIVQMFYRYHQ